MGWLSVFCRPLISPLGVEQGDRKRYGSEHRWRSESAARTGDEFKRPSARARTTVSSGKPSRVEAASVGTNEILNCQCRHGVGSHLGWRARQSGHCLRLVRPRCRYGSFADALGRRKKLRVRLALRLAVHARQLASFSVFPAPSGVFSFGAKTSVVIVVGWAIYVCSVLCTAAIAWRIGGRLPSIAVVVALLNLPEFAHARGFASYSTSHNITNLLGVFVCAFHGALDRKPFSCSAGLDARIAGSRRRI